MRRVPIFFLLTAVLLATPAVAQQQYGSIAGTVVDNQQQPLPGVTVTLSGPAMQGTRVAVTDTQGRFRFVPVPPGKDYVIRFELAGFNTLEKTGVVVNLGKETSIAAEMALSQFAEAITVTAERIVVDTTKSTVDTVVDWTLADTLATNRTFQTLMQLAPGVKAANNPNVHGSSGDDNAYLIDGVDTTDPRTNTWGTAINWDTIQEAQVQTAGFAAEYGRAMGGIINLVTKSGGNKLSFTARVVKQDSEWNARPGIEKETGRKKAAQVATDELRPSVTLGGPFVKDRLWFYLAYEGRDREQTFGRYATLADARAGNAVQEISNYKGHYFSGKLTWQVNPSHSVIGFYNEDPIDISNANGRYYYGVGIARSAENTQFQGGNNSSLQWYGVFTNNFFVEAKFQRHRQELNYSPQSTAQWNQVPFILDRTYAYYYGAPFEDYRSFRDRDGFQLAASYYLDTALGSHQFKGGVEFFDIKPRAGSYYNDAGYYQTSGYVGANPRPFRRFFYRNEPGPIENKDQYWALFIQDSWKVGKATFNLGLRAESLKAENNAGSEVLSFSFTDQLAPRLGFAYDLNGDVVRASLGRFYDLATNYIGNTMSSTPTTYERWDWTGTCTVDGRNIWTYPDTCWRLAWRIPVGESGYRIDPGLDPVYTDEFTVGYEKLLSPQMAASVTYVWREQPKGIEDLDPEYDGEYLWGNAPLKRVRVADGRVFTTDAKWKEYQALEFGLRKRFGPDGFQFIANYTYVLRSRSWAQARGFSQNSGYGDQPDAFDPLWYGRPETPHEVKFAGSWTAPWKTIFGITAFWSSGNVYTATRPGSYGTVPLERYGSSRVGNNWEADLHIEHPVTIGPVKVALYFDLFNAFNNQQPTARGGNSAATATFRKPTTWQAPRQVQVGFKLEY
ncbi:MAG: TonB-dependent receptor [Thermoanaerobaculum sp.]|nr:TonB-dependent receptor [Thermoanaerobaculum sp.]